MPRGPSFGQSANRSFQWFHWGGLIVTLFAVVAASGWLPGAAQASEIEATCPPATVTRVECFALRLSGAISPNSPGSGKLGGLSPADLRSAYNLPASGSSGATIAIVDAYNDPNAEADLAAYRAYYGLPACTQATGCFQKLNQNGEAGNYPQNEPGWSFEISIDLDMASAICPECHIRLVESQDSLFSNMNVAENVAAALPGTTVISNSWGAAETTNRTSEDPNYNHPGIPIIVSSGDDCYLNQCVGFNAASYPASSPYVIAVGGTQLLKAVNSRGWNETVWYEGKRLTGTGSGCSTYEPKPSWEFDNGCAQRTTNDVAAVAACASPASIYDSYGVSGWATACGTSVAAPIVAGVEALSSPAFRNAGASAFWRGGGRPFDVSEGQNAEGCGTYLCAATVGYDGPTGWGTPDGVPQLSYQEQLIPYVSKGRLQETWWSGTSWFSGAPTGTPEITGTPAVMFNGLGEQLTDYSAKGVLEQTWYNGSKWLSTPLPTAPEITGSPAVVFNANGEQLIDYSSKGVLEQTWWNGSSWLSTPIPTAPEITGDPVVVFNAYGEQLIIYNSKGVLEQTWYNGSKWLSAPLPTAPEISGKPAVVVRPSGEEVIEYASKGQLMQTWLTGSEWHSGAPAGAPEISGDPAMVINPAGERLVLYNSKGVLEQTWWNGSKWLSAAIPTAPEITGNPVVAFNAFGEEVIDYNSKGVLEQTWYNGSKWLSAALPGSPEITGGMALLFR